MRLSTTHHSKLFALKGQAFFSSPCKFKFEVQPLSKRLKKTKGDVKMAFSNKRKNMKMQYQHISEWERKVIERLVQAGSSNRYPRVEPVDELSLSRIFVA